MLADDSDHDLSSASTSAMSLFETPGWAVSGRAVPDPDAGPKHSHQKRQQDNKRKHGGGDDRNELVKAANSNLAKLVGMMDGFGSGNAKGSGAGGGSSEEHKSKGQDLRGKGKGKHLNAEGSGRDHKRQKRDQQVPQTSSPSQRFPSKGQGKGKGNDNDKSKGVLSSRDGHKSGGKGVEHKLGPVGDSAGQGGKNKGKGKGKGKDKDKSKKENVPLHEGDNEGTMEREANTHSPNKEQTLSSAPPSASVSAQAPAPSDSLQGLTPLQRKMREKLSGSRFRWINEQLYTVDSKQASELMKGDPSMFEEYHSGFRQQVLTWPTNPVDSFISRLSTKPPRTLIVDLGAGEGALAKALVPKGINVLSFDLLDREDGWVVAADVGTRIPLPGSDARAGGEQADGKEKSKNKGKSKGADGTGEGGGGGGQIVDVVVFCLSLMGTNWVNMVREARRILKKGGELKVAEVTSRFTSVDDFIELVSSLGFKFVSKDDSNTHFVHFEFVKLGGGLAEGANEKELFEQGTNLLKPCIYKKR